MAKQGDAGAQFNVGLLHSKQLIPQASQEQSVKWYLLAANNDHVNAQFNLDIKYDNGLGVESLEWNMQGVSMYIAPSESVFGV
jgi:hypothetical protein